MVQKGLTTFFEKYLTKEPLFLNKKVLQSSYTPETILHRDNEINQLASILAPALRNERPSNIFIYGKTGTGKTLSVKYTTSQIADLAGSRELPVKVFYINCKLKRMADTEYRLIAHLAREMGQDIPSTGLPTEEVYRIFYHHLDQKEQVILLVLDELDHLVKKVGDGILYNLTRINTELSNAQLSLIGISNDVIFTNTLDPRVKSSLSEEEIMFSPYNAIQLQHILRRRAKNAFKGSVLDNGVIEKCAAFAAREHGDARRALELLRVAGEIAERKGFSKVKIEHIDEAEDKIDRDRMVDVVQHQPKQFQITLYAILAIYQKRKDIIFTGEAYELYKGLCLQLGFRPLTQRRVSDLISEMDMLGLINAKVISKGRYGRTREIGLSLPESTVTKVLTILKEDLNI